MHKSVLLEESIESLNIKEDGVYVDATLGYGGHSGEILKRLKKGKLFAFDQDEYAINYCMDKFKDNGNIVIIRSNFSNIIEEYCLIYCSKPALFSVTSLDENILYL